MFPHPRIPSSIQLSANLILKVGDEIEFGPFIVCFSSDRRFLIANAQLTNKPIIYCNDAFCELIGYSRADIIQKTCTCEFLYGQETNEKAIKQLRHALQGSDEKEVEMVLYKNDGLIFDLARQEEKNSVSFRNEISMFVAHRTGEKRIVWDHSLHSRIYRHWRSTFATPATSTARICDQFAR